MTTIAPFGMRKPPNSISQVATRGMVERGGWSRSVSFTLDLANHRYQWGGRPAETLSGDLQFSLLTSQDQIASEQAGRIRFDPGGGSSGGRVSIAGGGQVWIVGIDWLSGHVSAEIKTR